MKKLFYLLIPVCFFVLAAPAFAVNLEMPLPGMPNALSAAQGPAEYIRYLFTFGLSLIGFLAVVTIIIGGVQYMLAGSVGSVDQAKSRIFGAVWGVGLLLCSYLLLATIDPSLTNLMPVPLNPLNIPKVQGGVDTYDPYGATGAYVEKPPVGAPTAALKQALDTHGQDLTAQNTTVLIDKGDRKLYLLKDGNVIASTEINIGQAESSGSGSLTGGKSGDKITPIGEFTITKDTRHDANGVYTKDGKSNLGTSFLGISAVDENGNYRGIGIHGSKDDSLRPTNGCIRVKNADSDLLFSNLKPGTKVKIQS